VKFCTIIIGKKESVRGEKEVAALSFVVEPQTIGSMVPGEPTPLEEAISLLKKRTHHLILFTRGTLQGSPTAKSSILNIGKPQRNLKEMASQNCQLSGSEKNLKEGPPLSKSHKRRINLRKIWP